MTSVTEHHPDDAPTPEAARAEADRREAARVEAAKLLAANIGGANVSSPQNDDDEPRIAAAVETIVHHPVFDAVTEPVSARETAAGVRARTRKKKVSAGARRRVFFLSREFSRTLGVVGESLITLGVVVMLFLGWQLWINDVIITNESTAVAKENVAKWTSSKTSTPTTSEAAVPDFGPAPVMSKVANAEVFGNLYIPRLGNDFIKVAAEGVEAESTLNRGYFGRYPDSQLPGEPGNFALAAHRSGYGNPFQAAPNLRTGDLIVLQTESGYYEYRVRNTEYVVPSQVDVVNAIPGGANTPVAGQSLLTITTCNPALGNAERLITYAVMVGWQPNDAGPPTEIASMVKA